jgi:subtilisin family serine protease
MASTSPPPRFHLDDPPFADRSGRGVRVAVIDSGIRAPHPHVPRVWGGAAVVVDAAAGSLTVVEGAFADTIGHGTAVAAAIHEKAPDAELLAVKVFDRDLTTSAPVLARAIRHAAERGARLINLSLGTSNAGHAAALMDAVRDAARCGALVVSAAEAGGEPCYPGALPGVVAARMDGACERDEIRVEVDGARVWITASPFPRPIPGVPPERNLAGVSFAVANATGFLARVLEGAGSGGLEEVRRALG